MNKKKLTLSTALATVLASVFMSCSGDGSVAAGDPTTQFVNEDVSTVEFAFDSSPNFEMDEGLIHVTSEDGSATKSIRNWVLSANYVHFVACGFVANIKVGEHMNFAGVELFKKGSYDDYRFNVYSNGKFVIRAPEKDILKLSADSSFIKVGEFNKVQVQTTDEGNVQVFVNDHLVKDIAQKELSFDLTDADKIAVAYNVLSTASKETPAEAWVKFESMQKPK